MKVAILNISIGSYSVFWKDFYLSSEEYFLPECEKDYFVFSDCTNLFQKDNKHVKVFYQDDMGWPYNTLKRFNMFCKYENELMKYDYIFFINANAVFKKKLGCDFINEKKNIITIVHPGLANLSVEEFPYERNESSRAYIPSGKGRFYVQGAFIGGKTSAFIRMINELNNDIEADLQEDCIAIWHDESFLNRYIVDRDDVQIMGKQYLYYEEFVFPWEPVILLRDKTKYIEKSNGRFKGRISLKNTIRLKIRNAKWRILIGLKLVKILDNCKNEVYIDKDIYL